ncbi:DUF1801 domain-containing protein [Paenibacillus spongiae]|uniref:DUF1801 domain-containing protein n=1 Tax=Paenibacillus spongiae TaxID=2909671 RepID=A0ABY5S6B1_9BACL|nr:DUF1801 domain-containing protein [Paenibacillus spongiae]UVI28392.1 DUF1801 domain-containing protein [Paenibacillus spongiae]
MTAKKTAKLSGHEQVIDFLNNLEHPLKDEIEEVRKIILGANEELCEHIKWKAPSFCYDNEDRITFNLHGKGYFLLIFHCGAKAKEHAGEARLLEDPTGLLDWVAKDRATVKFTDMNDVEAKREKLAVIITKWLEVTSP